MFDARTLDDGSPSLVFWTNAEVGYEHRAPHPNFLVALGATVSPLSHWASREGNPMVSMKRLEEPLHGSAPDSAPDSASGRRSVVSRIREPTGRLRAPTGRWARASVALQSRDGGRLKAGPIKMDRSEFTFVPSNGVGTPLSEPRISRRSATHGMLRKYIFAPPPKNP